MIGRVLGVPRRLRRAWREGQTDAEMHFDGYRAWRAQLAELGVADVRGLRVLDLGCGARAQLALLFAADGADVVGMDLLPVALGTARPRMWLATLRRSGVLYVLRTIVRDAVHTVRYWHTLAARTGGHLPFRRIVLVEGDASAIPFDDGAFDLVVSSAVWEHLSNVEAATAEVCRVLTTHGLAVIQIALFPALQGGHHAEWHSVAPDPGRAVRPWDHLRTGHLPLPTYLNEWRESQYRTVMERDLAILSWEDGEMRGRDYLTADLRDELRDYTERDLLLSGVTVWARPAIKPVGS